jgi:hypothetical protein
MGSPYLNSGETIVLTTSRVSVDAVAYDVMLTNERIFFIDNRKARLEPRIISLSTILSVQGGKTPAQDPVITLVFRPRKEGDPRQPLNLIFSQDPNENRRPERDDWVRGLVQLSISHQEKGIEQLTPAVPEAARSPGLRPMARHGVAPDMVRPLSNVVDHQKTPAPVTIIPEEVAGSGEIPVRETALLPARDERPGSETVTEAPETPVVPVRGTPPPVLHSHARVIIPQIIEELLPSKNTPAPKEEQVPAPVVVYEEALFRTIPTSVRHTTVIEERTPSQPQSEEPVPVPEAGVPEPVAAEQKEVPEIIRALHTGAIEPVIPEPAETETYDTTPEPGQESPEPVTREPAETETYDTTPEPGQESPELVTREPAETETYDTTQEPGQENPEPVEENLVPGIRDIPTLHVVAPVPKKEVQESADVPEDIQRREFSAAEAPARHPIPPAREIHPFRTTLAYAAVLLLVIALGAGAVLLFTQGPGQTDTLLNPIPTTVQVTPLLPETTQPFTPPVTVIPATTRTNTPVPSPAPVSVPQTGVWVRLTSTSDYFGSVGNAGTMRDITGTGDNFYRIFWDDRTVQVSVQKNDFTGALLTAAVYRDGTLIISRSTTSPKGSIEILIDPQTARAPGLAKTDLLSDQAATPVVLEDY